MARYPMTHADCNVLIRGQIWSNSLTLMTGIQGASWDANDSNSVADVLYHNRSGSHDRPFTYGDSPTHGSAHANKCFLVNRDSAS
jgi:hypothetical protein